MRTSELSWEFFQTICIHVKPAGGGGGEDMWKSTELNYKVSIDQDPRGHMKKKRKKRKRI